MLAEMDLVLTVTGGIVANRDLIAAFVSRRVSGGVGRL